MTRIRYWFNGFRAGFWERRPLPSGAWSRDPVIAAYYNGYVLGADIARRFSR